LKRGTSVDEDIRELSKLYQEQRDIREAEQSEIKPEQR
jgi:hypothetical protein